MQKKTALIVGILLLMAINFYMYWSVHLYYKGERTLDSEKRIFILKKSQQLNPFNDKVYYELGKTYFERGVKDAGNGPQGNENLNTSIQNFIQAVRLNPGSYAAHFRLAQALSYMNYFQPVEIDYYDQYKKAALLTTFDEEAYFEIGKIMMQNWEELKGEDKKYVVKMMKDVIDAKGRQGLMDVMHVWAVYVEDYSVMNQILPREAEAFRLYADFLGGRSLNLSERLDKLSKAESMEYERARDLYHKGQDEARIYHMKNALSHLSSSLRQLNHIKFYQSLTGEKLIEEKELIETKKSVLLGLIKLEIQRSEGLKGAENHLKTYLEMENEDAEIEELEGFLRGRNLLEVIPGGSESFSRLYFSIVFDFKQHRYREVIQQRDKVESLLFSGDFGSHDDLVKLLQIVGDSYQAVDFVYDAIEKIKEIDERLSKVLMPEIMSFGHKKIKKGETYGVPLLFAEESPIFINIELKKDSVSPLLAVFLNGRVIDEQVAHEGRISGLELMTKRGENILELKPINREIEIVRIVKDNG